MRSSKEKIQIIFEDSKVSGIRYFMPGESNSIRQVVEYRGQRTLDPCIYRSNHNHAAMLWEARRILAEMFQDAQADQAPDAVNH